MRASRIAVAFAVVLPLAAAPRAGRPEEPEAGLSSGFTIIVGGAYGLPRGDVDRDGPALDDVVKSRQALWAELGYRLHPAFRIHLFLQLSPDDLVDTVCPAGATCRTTAMRAGVDVQVHFLARRVLDPWVGIGSAVETLDTKQTGAAAAEVRWAGFEAPILLAGIDLRLGDRVALGPFVTASYAQYTSFREERDGTTRDVRIDPRARHDWLEAGVRVRLDL